MNKLPKVLYRGGHNLDNQKLRSDGISFTKNKYIAEYWASSKTDGLVFKYQLDTTANILTKNSMPSKIIPTEKPFTHQDKERIVNYAFVNHFDGVDLSELFNEDEFRIFNTNIITLI